MKLEVKLVIDKSKEIVNTRGKNNIKSIRSMRIENRAKRFVKLETEN